MINHPFFWLQATSRLLVTEVTEPCGFSTSSISSTWFLMLVTATSCRLLQLTVTMVAREFGIGEWGLGTRRKHRLAACGRLMGVGCFS